MLRLLMALAMSLSVGVGCGGEDAHRIPPGGDGDADSDADGDGDTDADGDGDSDVCSPDWDWDGDGYGPLCDLGEDCDDNDPAIHEGCTAECREGVPGNDCPCFGTEDPFECHSRDLYRDEHDRLRCRVGLMTCVENAEASPDTGYAWTACLDENGVDVNTP